MSDKDITERTTYRRADGALIWGDFAWTEDEEFFLTEELPVKAVRERWTLAERTEQWYPAAIPCCECGAEARIPTDWDAEQLLMCDECGGAA